jgi:hypothetical protein
MPETMYIQAAKLVTYCKPAEFESDSTRVEVQHGHGVFVTGATINRPPVVERAMGKAPQSQFRIVLCYRVHLCWNMHILKHVRPKSNSASVNAFSLIHEYLLEPALLVGAIRASADLFRTEMLTHSRQRELVHHIKQAIEVTSDTSESDFGLSELVAMYDRTRGLDESAALHWPTEMMNKLQDSASSGRHHSLILTLLAACFNYGNHEPDLREHIAANGRDIEDELFGRGRLRMGWSTVASDGAFNARGLSSDFGLFAAQAFEKDAMIVYAYGHLVCRHAFLRNIDDRSRFAVDMDGGERMFIIARRSYFALANCVGPDQANARLVVDQHNQIYLQAIRRIRSGEEIKFCYNLTDGACRMQSN